MSAKSVEYQIIGMTPEDNLQQLQNIKNKNNSQKWKTSTVQERVKIELKLKRPR